MPYFDYSGEIYIEVNELLSSLDIRERNQLIDLLIKEGHIIGQTSKIDKRLTYNEWQLENALNKLHGKYHNLTKEEEESIIKISKRF
jgi:hypothetical protein